MSHSLVHGDEGSANDFVVAIDFGGTKIALATADLDGHILEQKRIATNASNGALQAVERSLAVAHTLITSTVEQTRGRCIAAGAVSPGIIEPDRILLAPNVPDWEQLALGEMLRAGLKMAHVEVGNDAKAAAAAEVRWGSLQDADPAIYLTLSTGIAAALIIGGKVLSGAHGASGEIGYNLRGIADDAGAADGRAPLEEAVGGRALGERASRLLGENLTAAELFAYPDIRARFLIDEALAELAVHVANLAILIDPARIAVGGGLMNSGDLILSVLNYRLRFAVPFPPEVVPARFIHDAALHGAIALALTAIQDIEAEINR
jgi:glucokinase